MANRQFEIPGEGERIMVTVGTTNSILLQKASSLTPPNTLSPGEGIIRRGACGDGLHSWIRVTTSGSDFLMRF